MWYEIARAVESGVVTVRHHGRGYLLGGAVETLFTRDGLEAAGAEWLVTEKAWYIEAPDEATRKAVDRMARRTKAIASALAARGIRAKRDGAKTYDRRRAAQQRKAQREIQDVYRLALMEHERELRAVMERYEAALDPVEAIKLGYRRDELNAVMDELARGLANAGKAAEALTSSLLPEAAAISRDIAAWQIDNMAGVRVSRLIAHDTASLAIHRRYDKIAWRGVSDYKAMQKAVKQAVSRGLLTGENPAKIAERIEGMFTGNMAGSPYKRAVRIAQTETSRIMSEAAQETIRAANDDGIRCRNRWDATLDGKTRKSHRKVDGEVREVGERFSNGLKRPGDGGAAESINCRCCLTPVLEGFAPNAPIRRDNVTGKTMPYMSFGEWEAAGGLKQ